MSSLSVIFLMLGATGLAVFFLVRNDKNLYPKRLKNQGSPPAPGRIKK